ncbi:MAG TPA: GNAT family N-acetyltransferase [Stellaceae bacterium]|nr:GNAT family N-acetyltransferase [Stellaceae bacterium]
MGFSPGEESLTADVAAQAIEAQPVLGQIRPSSGQALLGRLAIDRGWQGRGLGAALLQDAVLRVVGAAESIGVRAILVHAISDEAKAFYEYGGLRPSPIDPMTLMITVEEAIRMLSPG